MVTSRPSGCAPDNITVDQLRGIYLCNQPGGQPLFTNWSQVGATTSPSCATCLRPDRTLSFFETKLLGLSSSQRACSTTPHVPRGPRGCRSTTPQESRPRTSPRRSMPTASRRGRTEERREPRSANGAARLAERRGAQRPRRSATIRSSAPATCTTWPRRRRRGSTMPFSSWVCGRPALVATATSVRRTRTLPLTSRTTGRASLARLRGIGTPPTAVAGRTRRRSDHPFRTHPQPDHRGPGFGRAPRVRGGLRVRTGS